MTNSASKRSARSKSPRSKRFTGIVVTTFAVGGCDEPSPPYVSTNPPYVQPGPCAALAIDDDSASTPWIPVTSRSIVNATGFNVDGINNAPTNMGGRGATVPGCDAVDFAGGKENAFAAATDASSGIVELGPALADTLEVRLTHLDSASVADDYCVGFELRVGGEGGSVVSGSGSLLGREAIVVASGPVDFAFATSVDPAACVDASCMATPIRARVHDLIASLVFDSTNEHVIAPSTIGGAVFFAASGGSVEPAGPGFEAELERFASAAGIGDDFQTQLLNAFASRQDLRTTPTWLTQCSYSDAPNTLSFALDVGDESP